MTYLDKPLHPTQRVAGAAQLTVGALQTWLKRPELRMLGPVCNDGRHPGTGRSRLFTSREAMAVVIAAELSRRGVPLEAAAKHATRFTDEGGGSGYSYDDARGDPDRDPGELYAGTTTYLRMLGDEAEILTHERLVNDIAGEHWSAIVINLSLLIADTRLALGLPA